MKSPVGAVRLLPDRRHRRPVRLHRRAQLAGHRAARPTRSGPGPSSSRSGSRTTTSPPPRTPTTGGPGFPYLDSITYKPIPDPDQLLASLQSGGVDIMHTDTARRHQPAAGRHLAGLHRRLEERGRRAGHGLHPAQPVQGPVRQPQGAPGRGLRHQLGPVRGRSSTRGSTPPPTARSPRTSPYYVADNGYPVSNVAKAKQLVNEVQQETGKPVAVTLNHTPDPSTTRIAEYLQQQLQTAGMKVTLSPGPAGRHHQHRPARHVRGPGVAPVRRRRPRPQLHLLEPDQRQHSGVLHQHGPQHRPQHAGGPAQGPPVRRPRPTGSPPTRRSAS